MQTNELDQDLWDVEVTYNGQTGDYPSKIPGNSSSEEIKSWVWESIRSGEIPGIVAGNDDLRDYKVQLISSRKLFVLRPSVEFGDEIS